MEINLDERETVKTHHDGPSPDTTLEESVLERIESRLSELVALVNQAFGQPRSVAQREASRFVADARTKIEKTMREAFAQASQAIEDRSWKSVIGSLMLGLVLGFLGAHQMRRTRANRPDKMTGQPS